MHNFSPMETGLIRNLLKFAQKLETFFRYGRFWTLLFSILSIVLLFLIGYIFFRPITPESGQIHLPRAAMFNEKTNPIKPVSLLRDKYGVVMVRADNYLQAFWGLGFAHAQDRLWQMEIIRSGAQGRLAMLFGPALSPADIFFKALNFTSFAQKTWDNLPEQEKNIINYYIAGINAYINKYRNRLAPEFFFYNYTIKPWTDQDVITSLYYHHWQMENPLRHELIRVFLKEKIEEKVYEKITDKHRSSDLMLWIIQNLSHNPAASKRIEKANQSEILFTATDLGLSLNRASSLPAGLAFSIRSELRRIPGQWYIAGLDTPKMKIHGATVPGIPLFFYGQNENIAWGYVKGKYHYNDFHLSKISLSKTINSSFPEKTIEQKKPVITSAFNLLPEFLKLKKKYSLNWSGFSPATDFQIFSCMLKMQKLSDACTILEKNPLTQPSAFFLFDRTGNNAVFTNHATFLQLLQSEHKTDIPEKCTYQRTFHTKKIIIENQINEMYRSSPVQHYHNNYYTTNSRPDEIFNFHLRLKKDEEKLKKNNSFNFFTQTVWDTHSTQDFYLLKIINQALQQNRSNNFSSKNKQARDIHIDLFQKKSGNDYLSLFHKEYPYIMKHILWEMNKWDGQYHRQNALAGLLHQFKIALLRNILYDKIGELLTDEILKLETKTDFLIQKFIELGQENNEHIWFDQKRTEKIKETFHDIIRLSFYDAIFHLQNKMNREVRNWHWGDMHYLEPMHPLAQGLGKFIFGIRPLPQDGYPQAMFNMQLNPLQDPRIQKGPSLILYFYLDTTKKNKLTTSFITLYGQHGNPLHTHYNNLSELWQEKKLVKIDRTSQQKKLIIQFK